MSITRAVRFAALGMLLAGCQLVSEPVDRTLGVRMPGHEEELYPAAATDCGEIERCNDMLAEIERWNTRTETRSALGAPSAVTFHSAVDEGGNTILLNRSGGASWIAVVTYADGSRASALVGCGVGLQVDRCFSSP